MSAPILELPGADKIEQENEHATVEVRKFQTKLENMHKKLQRIASEEGLKPISHMMHWPMCYQ